MTTVLICGSRSWPDDGSIQNYIDTLPRDTVIVTGCAHGADNIAAGYARATGLVVRVYKADWARLGKAAGPIRNRRMLSEGRPDRVVAFDQGGPGTADMLRIARAAGVECVVYRQGASGRAVVA